MWMLRVTPIREKSVSIFNYLQSRNNVVFSYNNKLAFAGGADANEMTRVVSSVDVLYMGLMAS